MTFDEELKLFEDEEKTKRDVIPTDREIFFVKFCRINNMSSSDLRKFVNSEEGKESGWSEEERKRESGSAAIKGLDIAKSLITILSKYSSYISKEKLPPNITDDEMEVITLAQKFCLRFIELPGEYKDAEGNLTPKAKALMLRSYNPLKNKLPTETTQEVKAELKKKMNEDISDLVGKANKFL